MTVCSKIDKLVYRLPDIMFFLFFVLFAYCPVCAHRTHMKIHNFVDVAFLFQRNIIYLSIYLHTDKVEFEKSVPKIND